MRPNPQKTADMFAFTKEILNVKFHFLSHDFACIQFKPLLCSLMRFAIKEFFSKCNQIRIWSHLLKKSLMENFIFCVVTLKFSVKYFTRKCEQILNCIKSYFTLSVFYQLKVSITAMQNPFNLFAMHRCVKSVRVRSFSGPYFPVFGLNTDCARVSFLIKHSLYSVRMRENTDKKNFEYGHFSRNANQLTALYVVTILIFNRLRFTPTLYYRFR